MSVSELSYTSDGQQGKQVAWEKSTHLEPAKQLKDDGSIERQNGEPQILERKLVRRIDIIILPLLALSLMIGYLDRGNIGNARVLGMQEELLLSDQQFLNAIMMFFLGYMLFELPVCLLLRYVHPRYLFGGAMLAFGTFAALFAVTKSYAGVMVLRVLIGIGEVFVNNAWIYLSLWYKPSELSLRSAAIYCMTPIAGAVSGLIAFGCGVNLQGARGIDAWQWLFIVEGVATIGFGIFVLILLPGVPEDVSGNSSFLFPNLDQRELIRHRFEESHNTANERFRPHQLLIGVKDPKMWLAPFIIGTAGIGIGAFSVFLPTFIEEFGFDPLTTQLYSMIPYAFGLVTLIGFAWLSDHLQKKAAVTLGCMTLTCVGFIILISTTNRVALVAGACFVAAGAYPSLVVGIAWNLSLHGGYTKRSLAIWLIQIFVQCYSIIASQIYRNAPRFFLGHGIALALYALGMVAVVALMMICSRANARKEQRARAFETTGEVDPEMQKSIEELCDFHPAYRYVL